MIPGLVILALATIGAARVVRVSIGAVRRARGAVRASVERGRERARARRRDERGPDLDRLADALLARMEARLGARRRDERGGVR